MHKMFIATLFLMMISSSCKTFDNSLNSGNVQQDINKTITVSAPSQVNPLKLHDPIGLLIVNHAEEKIELSYSYGVNVKIFSENQWLDVLTVTDAYLSPTVLSPEGQKDFRFTYIRYVA